MSLNSFTDFYCGLGGVIVRSIKGFILGTGYTDRYAISCAVGHVDCLKELSHKNELTSLAPTLSTMFSVVSLNRVMAVFKMG